MSVPEVPPDSAGRRTSVASPVVLVCSNRGPYVYERSADGFTSRRGAGGLSGALITVLEDRGGTWIAAPLGEGDRAFAQEHPQGREENGFDLRLLDVPPDLHRLHYEIVANEYLWFLFHYLFDVPSEPVFDERFAQAWDAYRQVNQIFANAAASTGADAVIFEDYHLMLAGRLLRKQSRSRRPLLYFHHTPWCEPSYFSILPYGVATEILESMLAFDVVGFHARRWADAFIACCDRLVKGTVVSGDTITHKRRTTRVLVAPVPIDAPRLTAEAHSPVTERWFGDLEEMRGGRKLLLRVDRIDLSKNPLRGFLAFEKLLERNPKLVNDVLFLALLYPSRLSVEKYQRYYTECLGVVRRVNERYGAKVKSDVGPIHLIFEDDYNRSLAAMRLYDVLLVNPVFDGLNLVAKEGPTLNERNGAVLLSTNAGVYEEIGSHTIAINPFDVGETADALERAVTDTAALRAARAIKLKKRAARSTPREWLEAQLEGAGL